MEKSLKDLSKKQLIQLVKDMYIELELLEIKYTSFFEPLESTKEVDMLNYFISKLINDELESELIDKFINTEE